jgi:hypothetical protein
MDPLRLTPYMEDCIRNLGENTECQSDEVLAFLAKLQIVVTQMPLYYGAKHSSNFTPAGLYVNVLQAQLQELRKDLPNAPGQNGKLGLQPIFSNFQERSLISTWIVIVLLHYHSVEMSVLELGLSMPTPSSLASCNSHAFQRLETLHAGLKLTQTFFDTYLDLPVYFARRLSFFTYAQIAQSLVFLHKLSTFESPDWNLDFVRQTVNFRSILDQLIGWFERVKTAEGVEQGSAENAEDIFSRIVRKFSRLKTWHEQKAGLNMLGPEMFTTPLNLDVDMNGISMDFLNDAWLEEMLGPWECQFNAEVP